MAAFDVKDTLFMVPLQEEGIEKFSFTWEGIQCLPLTDSKQGYKHTSTIAHTALPELLETISLSRDVKPYQYMVFASERLPLRRSGKWQQHYSNH